MKLEHELSRLLREHRFDLRDRLIGGAFWAAEHKYVSKIPSAFSDETQSDISDAVGSSWWYETRNRIIIRKLKNCKFSGTLWDIGSGTGVVTSALVQAGFSSIAVEPSKGGARLALERGLPSIHGTLEGLKLPNSCISQIGAFDVLEHVQDRSSFLAEIFRVLQPGGSFVLTVPALQILWSQADFEAGHYLRYSRRSLRKELELHGFKVQSLSYFFVLTVLPLLLIRVLPYRLNLKSFISDDSTLRAKGGLIGKFAQFVEISITGLIPFGSSLLAVAKKPFEVI